MLIESPNECSAVFGSQVGGTEGYVTPEEELVVQLGGTGTAYTDTDTFEQVPTDEVIDRSEIELTEVQVLCRCGSYKLRGDGIDGSDRTGYLGVVRHLAYQFIYRVLVPRQGFGTQRVPGGGS